MSGPSSLRPDAAAEDVAAWTRAVFAAGDYAGAAHFGARAARESVASRAMLVGDSASLQAIADCDDDASRLHHAAALWIHGDDAGAIHGLRRIAPHDEHAHNLLRLLCKPRIQVLSQLPWLRDSRTGMPSAAMQDPRFEIRNVGHHRDDLPNQPYASVHGFLGDGFQPDLYLCAMVEWHHLPPDLQTLACPILGHIADHDLHIQTLHPWLALFDELLVTDRTEWLDVQGLTNSLRCDPKITSFAKSFGIAPGMRNLPPASHAQRPLDFFVSGTMLDAFHPDKAAKLHELLSIPDIDMRVIRGFAGDDAYEGLLAASKVSFSFVRRPGAMPTRALEALGMGCALALQEESILNLFVGREEGVATYGPTTESLSSCVQSLLANWADYGPAAQRGAATIRSQFDREQVASQYLRYATFRAAAPRPPRSPTDTSGLVQKRICAKRTWLPASSVTRRRTMQSNFHFLRRRDGARPTANSINEMARELLLEYAYWVDENAAEPRLLTDALELWRMGCERFPDHLVLRFNRIRAAFEFGDSDLRSRAMLLAFETLEADPQHWRVHPMDDVLAFDIGSEHFNYRDYLAQVTELMRASNCIASDTMPLVQRIRASCAGYFARQTGRVDVHELAASLDPEFARYRLDFARSLLARDDTSDLERATPILERLAAGSTLFAEAIELLESLRLRADAPAIQLPSHLLSLPLRRLHEQSIDASIGLSQLVEQQAVSEPPRPRGEVGVHDARSLAVLVPFAGSDGELSALLGEIQGQTIARKIEVHVALPIEAPHWIRTIDAHRRGTCELQIVDVPLVANFAEALNACLQSAKHLPLLTVASPGTRLRADALEILVEELDQGSTTMVACGNEGRTRSAPATFDPTLCTEVLCNPRHSAKRMFETNCLGFHAVWRATLHDRFGEFDPAMGAATEYEFWLRTAPHVAVAQRHEILSTDPAHSPWLRIRDPECDPRAAARARTEHWPTAWGPRPNPRACRPLPAVLFNPALADEAASHQQLAILTAAACREVCALQSLYGAALMLRDLETAERLLRTVVELHPSLLSGRTLYARLLETTNAAAAPDALRDVLDCDPYPSSARHYVDLAGQRGVPILPSLPPREIDRHRDLTELTPGPTT